MRRSALFVLSAVVVSVSACTSQTPEPSVEPTPKISASASPTVEELSPEDVVRAYVAANGEFQRTGNVELIEGLTYQCEPCDEFANLIQGIHSEGGFVDTLGWQLVEVESVKRDGDRAIVDVWVKAAPTRYQPSADSSTQSLPGGKIHERFDLELVEGRWLISDYSELV